MLINISRDGSDTFLKKRRRVRFYILKKMLKPPFFIGLSLIFFIVVLLVWATVSPLRMVVRAEGKIIPSGRNQLIQHLEGGQVLSINVSEGQFVEKGQLLARIRDVMVTSQISERKTKEASLIAKIARLKAEATSTDMVVGSTVNGVDKDYYMLEFDAWIKRKEQLAKEIDIYNAQINQKKEELQEKNEKIKNLKKELLLSEEKLNISEGMLKLNASSKLEILDARLHVQTIRNDLSEAQSILPRMQSLIEESKSRVSEKESRFRSEAAVELATSQSELKKVQEELNVGKDRLMRTELRSPVSGHINKVNVSTIGEVVKAGSDIVEITPSGQPVIIEAEVKPSDRAELSIGLPVEVMLSAYNYATFGYAKGRLTEISSDTLPNNKGEYFYRVKVTLDGKLNDYNNKLIAPGMVATAEIVVGKRTVLSYLLSPLQRFTHSALTESR